MGLFSQSQIPGIPSMTIGEYVALATYVGRVFYIDFREVKVEMLLEGVNGMGYYLCRWRDTDEVYFTQPLEVLIHFDDQNNPIIDFPNDLDLESKFFFGSNKKP